MATEVIEAEDVLRPVKSLLRTSDIQVLEFSFILMFLKILESQIPPCPPTSTSPKTSTHISL